MIFFGDAPYGRITAKNPGISIDIGSQATIV